MLFIEAEKKPEKNKFFRINRSQSKASIFNNLIVKLVEANKIYQTELIIKY